MIKNRQKAFWIGVIGIMGSEFIIRNLFLTSRASETGVVVSMITEWLIFAFLVLFWIPRIEEGALKEIGLGKFKGRYIWLGFLAYLLTTGAMIVSGFILEANNLEPIRSLQPVLKTYSLPTLFGLFFTGTFFEEIVYRGYLIERLTVLLRHRSIAGIISWVLFTLVHLTFFGPGPTIDISILSAALVLLYLKENSVWPSIILHGINNILSYLVFPIFL